MLTRILEAALASIDDGLLVLDTRGVLLFANASAARLLGGDAKTPGLWPAGPLSAYSEDGLRQLPAEELPAWRALRGETVRDVPLRLVNEQLPHGADLLVSAHPLLDQEDHVNGVVLVVKDATYDRRTAQE